MVSSYEYQAQGVVLQAIEFRDYDQILLIFTREYGLVKLIVKGVRKRQKKGMGGTGYAPLQLVEILYKDSKGEIAQCVEISSVNSYLALRTDLNFLQSSCDILLALRLSQMVGRAAAPLYDLMLFYFEKIPVSPDPFVLSCSFQLKLLKYEGLLSFQIHHEGLFTKEEEEIVQYLAFCQSYQQLILIDLTEEFRKKVERLFREYLEQ